MKNTKELQKSFCKNCKILLTLQDSEIADVYEIDLHNVEKNIVSFLDEDFNFAQGEKIDFEVTFKLRGATEKDAEFFVEKGSVDILSENWRTNLVEKISEIVSDFFYQYCLEYK